MFTACFDSVRKTHREIETVHKNERVKHISVLFFQAGENLVPEQKNEREETEKRDAAVLYRLPPVLCV